MDTSGCHALGCVLLSLAWSLYGCTEVQLVHCLTPVCWSESRVFCLQPFFVAQTQRVSNCEPVSSPQVTPGSWTLCFIRALGRCGW